MIKAGQWVVANPDGKKHFLIPVSWEVYDAVRVKADSLKEAYEWMKKNSDTIPLGTEPDYVDGSYKFADYEEAEAYLYDVIDA